MRSKVVKWLILLLTVAITGNMIRTIASLSRVDNIIKEAKDRLQKVTDDNQNLQKELAKVGSQQFIEREARNKLNLGREGDIVVILPPISPIITPAPEPPENSPNWQKWVKLFL